MGICLFTMLGSQIILSVITPTLLSTIGISWFLAMLLIFQVLIVIGMVLWLRETKGLNMTELYNLYRPADMHITSGDDEGPKSEMVEVKSNNI